MNHNPPPETDEHRKVHKKKDTKHWCKGKVGREHILVIEMSKWPYRATECGWSHELYPWQISSHVEAYRKNHWICYHEVQCGKCGKIMETWLSEDKCPRFSSPS